MPIGNALAEKFVTVHKNNNKTKKAQ